MQAGQVRGKRHYNMVKLIRNCITESGEWGVRDLTDTPRTDEPNGESNDVSAMTLSGLGSRSASRPAGTLYPLKMTRLDKAGRGDFWAGKAIHRGRNCHQTVTERKK